MEETRKRPSLRAKIIAAAIIAALLVALGVAVVSSVAGGSEKSALTHLDNQRVILDNSMNLYDPLVTRFSTRYSNAFIEASDDAAKTVFADDAGRISRDSEVNRARLERMAASPALSNPEVAKAFKEFKRAYGEIISYNDQLVVNLTNVTRSVTGKCNSIHSGNISGENYAEEYIEIADACLAAVGDAKKSSDDDTATLLSEVERVISKQRDLAQDVIDSTEQFDRTIASTYLALGLLDINEPFEKAQAKWDADTQARYTSLVDEANASNAAFEKALKKATESKGE